MSLYSLRTCCILNNVTIPILVAFIDNAAIQVLLIILGVALFILLFREAVRVVALATVAAARDLAGHHDGSEDENLLHIP